MSDPTYTPGPHADVLLELANAREDRGQTHTQKESEHG